LHTNPVAAGVNISPPAASGRYRRQHRWQEVDVTITIYSQSQRQAALIRDEALHVFSDLGISGNVIIDNDEFDFASAGVMFTPAVSVDGTLISNGWVPAPQDLAAALSGGRY